MTNLSEIGMMTNIGIQYNRTRTTASKIIHEMNDRKSLQFRTNPWSVCVWMCLRWLFNVHVIGNVCRFFLPCSFVRSLKCWSHKCDFVSFDNGIGVTFFLLFRYKNFHWWYFIRIKRFVLSGVIAILILNLWLPLALLLLFFYSWRILCLYHSNDLFTFSGEFAWLSCIPFSFSPFSLFFLNFIFQAS